VVNCEVECSDIVIYMKGYLQIVFRVLVRRRGAVAPVATALTALTTDDVVRCVVVAVVAVAVAVRRC